MVWRKWDSLVWWAITQLGYMVDPRWAHIHFIWLTSCAEIESFTRAVESVLAYPSRD